MRVECFSPGTTPVIKTAEKASLANIRPHESRDGTPPNWANTAAAGTNWV